MRVIPTPLSPPHIMPARNVVHANHRIRIRRALSTDLDALIALEHSVFATDQMSRRSLRHFLRAPTAIVLVAEAGRALAGTATILLRPRSTAARLYSIAVAPHMAGRGVASKLLAAVERAARERECTHVRLEVHVTNHRAISRYHKTGYEEFGRRHGYYEDGGDALRLQKSLSRDRRHATAVK
jgi:ribosomal protein S18 acetylase RimI-like enzyme